jgi:hypothetical protein
VSTEIYHFAPAEDNAAGFSFNRPALAVYQIAGHIHQTYRNHPDYPQGKPHWLYIQQDGTLTTFESEISADDVRKQILNSTQPDGHRDPKQEDPTTEPAQREEVLNGKTV